MLRCYLTLLLPLLLLRAAGAVEPRFEEGVGRIFSTRCVTCHNGKNAEGALSLATGPEALAGGDSGEAIVPGDAAASLLVEYISGPKPEMPKEDDPLSAEEIATISAWIEAGARWPAGLNLEPRDGWWSRQPLVRPAVPEPSPGAPKLHTPIDHFLAAKLHTEGLAFSPEADRRTLIRRLYFDLLGLPPAPEDVQRFENDSQHAAYERPVDRLLEHPA